MKKLYIETLGCQMNKSDSERIAGMLSHFGYETIDTPRKADLLIINTCNIRQLSADKAYSKIGLWGKWKKTDKPHIKIGICGCVAQQDKQNIRKRAPYVDLIFGTHNIYELPELIKKIENDEKVCAVPSVAVKKDANQFKIDRNVGVTAWIPIIEGCNNFCTYCIVPLTRGRERSRTPDEIIIEAENAIKAGYKEITLLGQNVDSYGKDFEDKTITLANLLRRLDSIQADFRIRFLTSYPTDITDDLINAVEECKKVCEYFHIPMQSGNTEVLKEMNRRYTREEYVKIANNIRNRFKDVEITSDFIAGFPGETEEQFKDTLTIIDELELDYSNTAAYSLREFTKAARMTDKFLSEEEKCARLERLNDKNKESCLRSNKKCMNKTFEILVESKEEKNGKTILTGRARNNKLVHFESDTHQVGDFVDVKITKAQTWCLYGELTN